MDPFNITIETLRRSSAKLPEPKILLDREVSKDTPTLRYQSHAAACNGLDGRPSKRCAIKAHITSVDGNCTHHRKQGRRLPRPIGADQPKGFTALYP
jgi:hypothetical protein